jgi:hypothetical protein
MVVSIVISYLTNEKGDIPIDESLISPVSRSLLTREVRIVGTTQYRSVDIPLESLDS